MKGERWLIDAQWPMPCRMTGMWRWASAASARSLGRSRQHISCRPGMSKGTINIEYLRLRRELGSYDERELQAALDYLEEHLHG